MGGFDDHVAIMGGDWLLPSPSPRSYFSSTINDDVIAQSTNSEDKTCPTFLENADHKDQNPTSTSNEPKASFRSGGLMERRAGFNAQRLNTGDLDKQPEVRSPFFTVPPGLSPTALLDSPVFLSNSLVLPSPTTGKFSFAPSVNNRNSTLMVDNSDESRENISEDVNGSSFAFKPSTDSSSFPYFNATNKVNPYDFAPQSNAGFFQQANYSESQPEVNRGINFTSGQTYNNSNTGITENSPPLNETHKDDGERKSYGDPNAGEDGYNWRKYGQKQVKGSEYPRSYFKCTHQNCPVKKKVERSQEGHITEIIYKGAHNHLKPPPNRRSAFSSSNIELQLDSDQSGNGTNGVGPVDWSQENPEAIDVGQEYGNESGTLQAHNDAKYEPVDGSSTFSNDEDDDDRVTHGSVSLGCDGEGEESDSKRRRIETYASDVSGATRAIREPRVVVQTTSEVDILDDGYRWRKYGQKVVKGNPNPRSYYKCTSPGCNVRKHVERASHDLKSVITTYEGKHNHDVPAARNNSHINSGGGSSVIHAQQTQMAASNHGQRPQPSQIHMARFEIGSYGFPGRPPIGPGPGFGYGINQNGLASLGMCGLPVNPYLRQQGRPLNDMGFMVPKGEPNLEPVGDSGLNDSNGLVYQQQFISRLPLGP